MGQATAEVKGIKTDITIEEAAKVDIVLEEVETSAGKMMVEKRDRPEHPGITTIPVYLIQTVKKGTKNLEVRMHFNAPPPEVDKEAWYPCLELRMTQDTMDNMDYVPDWKRFPLLDTNNAPIRDEVGRQRQGHFYIDWNIQECSEEEDGMFFPVDPIQGKDIRTEMAARGGSKASVITGASRRRADQ